MHLVSFSMGCSLDGFCEDRNGSLDWSVPSPEVFRWHIDQLRGTSAHVFGRRLYEAMVYWETDHDYDDDEREWAELWRALPKVVLSTTLTEVTGANTRLATGSLADELARLRDEPGDGVIAIGGAGVAAAAADLGLVDEYLTLVYPTLLGSGKRLFQQQSQLDLELVETAPFDAGVVALRHRVRR